MGAQWLPRSRVTVTTSAGAVDVTAPRSTTSVSTRIPVSGSGSLPSHLAAVGAQDPEDRRDAFAAVSARALVGRFRVGAGAVPGQRAGAVGLDYLSSHRAPGRPRRRRSPSGTCRLWTSCTCGRTASMSSCAPRRPEAVPAGDDRGARGSPQGLVALTDGHREAAESCADLLRDCRCPRHARPGAGRWGRCAGILERAARGVPADPRAALLVPQDIECSCCAAEARRTLGAKKTLAEIWNAEDKSHACDAAKQFPEAT